MGKDPGPGRRRIFRLEGVNQQTLRNRIYQLPDDQHVHLVDQPIEGDGHRSLDGIFHRYDAILAFPGIHGIQDVGNRRILHQFQIIILDKSACRLMGECPCRSQICNRPFHVSTPSVFPMNLLRPIPIVKRTVAPSAKGSRDRIRTDMP